MKLAILPRDDFYANNARFDAYISDEEATDAFWSALDSAQDRLRKHLSQFGPEGDSWELPGHHQRCRVLYMYLYADSLYASNLLPEIAAALPQDGKQWCAQLECYTDARILPNGNPLCIGWATIAGDTVYISADWTELIAYAPRLGL